MTGLKTSKKNLKVEEKSLEDRVLELENLLDKIEEPGCTLKQSAEILKIAMAMRDGILKDLEKIKGELVELATPDEELEPLQEGFV